jgi:chromosomal replication initiator protein
MEAIWTNVKAAIKKNIPGHTYRMWIEPIRCQMEDTDTLILSCPNRFSQKRVQTCYQSLIKSELDRITGKDYTIRFNIYDTHGNRSREEAERPPERPSEIQQLVLPDLNIRLDCGRFLRRGYTFDNFIVGGNNDFAYSAALSFASQQRWNNHALFLLSETGLGKSHLSQAIGHHILSQKPSAQVYYVTAEDFTNEMIKSLKNNSIDRFKEKYRNQCDVLLLEDVQFLTGKEKTQAELAMTLDYLFEADKKIIFSSSYLPGDIPKMSEQLVSRLSSGVISRIEVPDFKTRVKILRDKSVKEKCSLPGDIIDYLASELNDNVRQLESGLIGVVTKSSLMGMPIDLELAESVVSNIARRNKTITIDIIKKIVSREYNITVEEMVSKSRKKMIVKPRQVAIYLSRKYTDQPLKVIGKSFNRYHATALHSIGVVEKQFQKEGNFRRQMEYFYKKLESGKF